LSGEWPVGRLKKKKEKKKTFSSYGRVMGFNIRRVEVEAEVYPPNYLVPHGEVFLRGPLFKGPSYGIWAPWREIQNG